MKRKYKILLISENNYLADGIKWLIKSINIDIDPCIIKISHCDYFSNNKPEIMGVSMIIIDIPQISISDFKLRHENILDASTLTAKNLTYAVQKTVQNKVSTINLKTLNGNLSERELQYLELLLQGVPERKISRLMHISYRTVSTHRRNVRIKMGISNRNKFIQYISMMQSSNTGPA